MAIIVSNYEKKIIIIINENYLRYFSNISESEMVRAYQIIIISVFVEALW